MNKPLLDALETCLQALEKGETLEAALGRYPHLAVDLRPLLESAQAAWAVSRRDIPANVIARGRAHLLAAVMNRRAVRAPRQRTGLVWRIAFAAFMVLVFLALTGKGLLTASAQALPGDVLYPLKRTVENFQLQLAPDPAQQTQLEDDFKQRRVDETQALITEGRVETVEFDGTVTAQTSDGWIVAGIPVIIAPQTSITGVIAVGVEVEVTGQTEPDGRVRAASLTVMEAGNSGEGPDFFPEATGTPEHRGRGPQGTETPEPTDTHHDDSTVSQTAEPTHSHNSDEERTTMPEPTELPELTPTPH